MVCGVQEQRFEDKRRMKDEERDNVMVKKYIKMPVAVEAVRLDIPNNDREVLEFIGAFDENGSAIVDFEKKTMAIPTLEGVMTAQNGDYIIKGIEGEFYPCKASIFEASYAPANKSEGMTFGQAIEALNRGERVSRKGWNGKGMYLWKKPAFEITPEICSDPKLKQAVIDNGGRLLGLPTICMCTHDSTGRKAVLTGWLASQSDIFGEDWFLVK